MWGGAGAGFDYDFIRDRIAQSLLRDLWDRRSRLEFLRNFTSSEAPSSIPPVVGVGISESQEGKSQLHILSTLEPATFLFQKFLAVDKWEDIRFEVQKTGLAIACARPAQGGDSISCGSAITGTIGCAVKDRGASTVPYLMSCNHVLAKLNKGAIGKDVVWQPGQDDGGGPSSRIGVLHKYRRIQVGPQSSNLIDAALCKVDNLRDVATGIRKLGALTGYVEDPPLGLQVKKHGRTSGVTTGKVRIKNLSVIVKYDTGEEALFDKQLGIIGVESNKFAERGDSGSIVVDDKESAVGLLFSVTEGLDLSFVNLIKAVLDEFSIALA